MIIYWITHCQTNGLQYQEKKKCFCSIWISSFWKSFWKKLLLYMSNIITLPADEQTQAQEVLAIINIFHDLINWQLTLQWRLTTYSNFASAMIYFVFKKHIKPSNSVATEQNHALSVLVFLYSNAYFIIHRRDRKYWGKKQQTSKITTLQNKLHYSYHNWSVSMATPL